MFISFSPKPTCFGFRGLTEDRCSTWNQFHLFEHVTSGEDERTGPKIWAGPWSAILKFSIRNYM